MRCLAVGVQVSFIRRPTFTVNGHEVKRLQSQALVFALLKDRVARLAVLGQISEMWPRLKLVGLKNFGWLCGLF